MYCSHCGKEVNDEAVVCIHCGCAIAQNKSRNLNQITDEPSTGFAVLGFFIPLVGLILYLVYKDTTPLRAKSAGKGAIWGFCSAIAIPFILGIILGIISAIAAAV